MNNECFNIVVPFYDEVENFKVFITIIESLKLDKEVFILLDNGSSNDEMKKHAQTFKNGSGWKYVYSDVNLGYGGGIIYAAKFCENDYVAWMPGNLKVSPDSVYRLLQNIDIPEENFILKAHRKKRLFGDFIKTKIFGIIVSFTFGTYLYDAGGTPNLISKSFFDRSEKYPKDFLFDVFVYYFCKKKKYKIIRPRIAYTERNNGTSHWQKGILSEIKLTLKAIKSKKNWDIITNDG
jgi:glycosyltransferase involved in cell wall biosynthesis